MSVSPILRPEPESVKDVGKFQEHLRSLALSIPCDLAAGGNCCVVASVGAMRVGSGGVGKADLESAAMTQLTRRQFIRNSAASLAMTSLHLSAATGKRWSIGFSTLACPNWSWVKILDFARQTGFDAIELRVLQGSVDLPGCPEFSSDRIADSKKQLASRGLRISCVSSSANMHDLDPKTHEEQLADARRFIDLASALGTPYVRVFPNKLVEPRDLAIQHIARSLRELADYAGPRNVTVLMESHGDFTDSATLRSILEEADSPHVGLLWDVEHTYVDGKEDPAFTFSRLGKYIRHTHLRDSRRTGNDWHYVLTGRGEVPIKRMIEVLVANGYKGSYTFEWLKAWHPDIEEPEIALPDYFRVVRQYLRDASDHQKVYGNKAY